MPAKLGQIGRYLERVAVLGLVDSGGWGWNSVWRWWVRESGQGRVDLGWQMLPPRKPLTGWRRCCWAHGVKRDYVWAVDKQIIPETVLTFLTLSLLSHFESIHTPSVGPALPASHFQPCPSHDILEVATIGRESESKPRWAFTSVREEPMPRYLVIPLDHGGIHRVFMR